MERVPVMCGLRCVELADAARVKRLASAPNAKAIRRHRDGKLVEIQLRAEGDDSHRAGRTGNPLSYSYDSETEENPATVWTLKRIPSGARAVFRAVVEECSGPAHDSRGR